MILLGHGGAAESPLTRGRELKCVVDNRMVFRAVSPLTRGRELKSGCHSLLL